MVRSELLARVGVLLLAPLVLSCRMAAQATPPQGASGRVVSGEGQRETAISGAAVELWALSTAKVGAPAVNLLTAPVVSDSNGNFAVEGLFHCPTPATLVYFIATGGSPGLPGGVQNPVIKLGTAIGPCSGSAAEFLCDDQ